MQRAHARIDAMGEEVAGLRQEFLSKRVERRQAETLIQETEARNAIESSPPQPADARRLYGSRCGYGSGARADGEPFRFALQSLSLRRMTLRKAIDRMHALQEILRKIHAEWTSAS